MRRKDREITDQSEIEAIISRARICRLAMCDDGWPYVVPLSFGYQDRCVYFHCATKGKKIDIIKKNPRVCVEFDIPGELVTGPKSCEWTMHYESVIGYGDATVVEDPAMKRHALDRIMANYGAIPDGQYAEKVLAQTAIIQVRLQEITGKRHQ